MENKIIANIIVDLYEIRASTMPYKPEHFDKIHDAFKYQFFTSAIAQLFDKYKIRAIDIDEVIKERAYKKSLCVACSEKENSRMHTCEQFR